MRVAMDAVARDGQALRGGDLLHRRHPRSGPRQIRPQILCRRWPRSWRRPAPISSRIKDMAGLLKPAAARVLVKALREAVGLPIHFHTHDTSRHRRRRRVLAAVEAGVDAVDAAMDALSGNTSQPCLGSIVEALRGTERDTGPRSRGDPADLVLLGGGAQPVRGLRERPQGPALGGLSARDAGRPVHQPQGAGALARARDALARGGAGLSRRQPMFGDIVKVTPSSKVVGDMALMMVSAGADRRRRRGPGQGIAFPDSVVDDAARRSRPAARRLAGGAAEEGAEGRDADHRAAGLAAAAGRPRRRCAPRSRRSSARKLDEYEFASYLMYPKVFTDFAGAQRRVRPGQRAADAGLFLRHAAGRRDLRRDRARQDAGGPAAGDRRDRREGQVTRLLRAQRPAAHRARCRTARAAPRRQARRKAEDGNDAHVGAPMPGVVSTRRGGRRARRSRPATCC